MRETEVEINMKKGRPPASKKELLKGLLEAMEKGKKVADLEMEERDRERKNKCHCDGFYCEC